MLHDQVERIIKKQIVIAENIEFLEWLQWDWEGWPFIWLPSNWPIKLLLDIRLTALIKFWQFMRVLSPLIM